LLERLARADRLDIRNPRPKRLPKEAKRPNIQHPCVGGHRQDIQRDSSKGRGGLQRLAPGNGSAARSTSHLSQPDDRRRRLLWIYRQAPQSPEANRARHARATGALTLAGCALGRCLRPQGRASGAFRPPTQRAVPSRPVFGQTPRASTRNARLANIGLTAGGSQPISIPSLGDGVMLGPAWIDRPVDTQGLRSLLPRPP
jgi:hypothetical protein